MPTEGGRKKCYFCLTVFRAYNNGKVTKTTNLQLDNNPTFGLGRSLRLWHTTDEMNLMLLYTHTSSHLGR